MDTQVDVLEGIDSIGVAFMDVVKLYHRSAEPITGIGCAQGWTAWDKNALKMETATPEGAAVSLIRWFYRYPKATTANHILEDVVLETDQEAVAGLTTVMSVVAAREVEASIRRGLGADGIIGSDF